MIPELPAFDRELNRNVVPRSVDVQLHRDAESARVTRPDRLTETEWFSAPGDPAETRMT
jgi:hypothetical protein